MSNKLPKNCLTDTGFWIGYFEERDEHHKEACEVASVIFDYRIICPFPTLYEFLNTRFSRKKDRVEKLDLLIKNLEIKYIFDDKYRNDLVSSFIFKNRGYQKISAVDIVINQILEDVNIKIDYLVTFNKVDFSTACRKRGIEIFP